MKSFSIHLEFRNLNCSRKFAGACLSALLLGACAYVGGGADSPPPNYGFEIIPADEAKQKGDITAKTGQLQHRRAQVFKDVQGGRILRGVHPKSHGCVVADFTINPDIAADLQVGLFSGGEKTYPVLIRFSNASVRLAPDLEGGNGSRGMAIKLLDVGEKVIVKDAGENNQDFLMINTRAFAFPNVRSYQRLTNALLGSPSGADPGAAFSPADDWTVEDRENLEKTLKVIGQIRQKTVRNPTEVQYFGAAPSLFGSDRAMKFAAEPCGGEKLQEPFDNDPDENYLHQALEARMAQHQEPVCFDFKIQVLGINEIRADRNSNTGESTGDLIEDATRVWDENAFPFTKVARIIIPTSPTKGKSLLIDCDSRDFNPWHSLAAHQPLGGINRLRKPVYISSAANRHSDAPAESVGNLKSD